jgi:hypothetical protein
MHQPSKEEFERHRVHLPERGTVSYSELCKAFTASRPRRVMQWGGFVYNANSIEIDPIADAVQVATEWGQSWQSS